MRLRARDIRYARVWRVSSGRVFGKYIALQRANADRPEAHINLGLFYSERRDAVKAEAEYRAALRLARTSSPRT